MTETTEPFHVSLDVARAYEETFVPAIFADWAPHTVAAAGINPRDHVLDVACGTGIVARTALAATGGTGSVTGVDLNEAMLTVASEIEPRVTWQHGDVARLPFPDDRFDATACQMACMFFPDRPAAFAELARVTRAGGRVALTVPASLEQQSAYRRFVEAAARHAGAEALSLLDSYWVCGDVEALATEANVAGLTVVDRRTRAGRCAFDSVAHFVEVEVNASPLADRVDDETVAAITADLEEMLRPPPGSEFTVPLMGHVVAFEVTR